MYRAYFVDDEPFVLAEFSSNPLFLECGYKVAGSASDPKRALIEIKSLSPDVVFTDLKMPGLAGVDMMERLRKKGETCEFVIISSYPEFEESVKFFRLDGFDYLLKPVSDYDLQRLLVRLSEKLSDKRPHIKQEPEPGETVSDMLNRAIEIIREDLVSKHTIESLSKLCMTNQTTLNRLFMTHLGMTYIEYITKLRMEEAARLLKETKKEVKEIAGLCGYSDYFYFCRVFRKQYMHTPTQYRSMR